MKIRSIHFNDFRNFRGEHTISFVNELTDDVDPVAVLAGSNGTGKTTVLETIEALVLFATTRGTDPSVVPAGARPLVEEAWREGFVAVEVELSKQEARLKEVTRRPLCIAAGRQDYKPENFHERWPDAITTFRDSRFLAWEGDNSNLKADWIKSIEQMHLRRAPFFGGLIYFPSDRTLFRLAKMEISEPSRERPWVDRLTGEPHWGGNLEKHWVWENYLDLEKGDEPGTRLKPLVSRIEQALGGRRRIFVREGRIRVETGYGTTVGIQDLPSGERQLMLILGELARRARPGLVCLIDEPELSLHPSSQHALAGSFSQMARDFGMQFILATHSREIVQAFPNSTIFLDSLEAEGIGRHPAPDLVEAA